MNQDPMEKSLKQGHCLKSADREDMPAAAPPSPFFSSRAKGSLAFAVLFALLAAEAGGVGAQQAQAQGAPTNDDFPLQALGTTINQRPIASTTTNPFEDGGAAQHAPQNNSSQASHAALTHDGNVIRQSNVPVPAHQGQQPRQAQQPQSQSQPQQQAQPQQQQAQTNEPRYAYTPGLGMQPVQGHPANAASVAPLPDPRLPYLVDIPQEALNRLAPANVDQIRQIMQELYLRQGAAVTPLKNAVNSRASQHRVDLSPGAAPPVIRVLAGMGATVNFVDGGGNPWPISFASNFNSQAASVTQMAPHVLSISANSHHLTGSVGVMLDNLHTPINFIVTPAQENTDYRVDLIVPGLSPDAPPMVGAIESRPEIGGDNLTDYLYGATPNSAQRLNVSGVGSQETNTRAWQDSEGLLILRTTAKVVSPGWYDVLPTLDGTSVYRLPSTPIVRVSVNGKIQSFSIDGLQPLKASEPRKAHARGMAAPARVSQN